MSVIARKPPAPASKVAAGPRIEPLENGDVLTATEFMRRYEAMPEVKKAELIEGVVYMGSPVRLIHAEPDALVHTWLGTYAAHTPGTCTAANVTVRLDPDNVPQPDAVLRLRPEWGGRCQVIDDYLEGAPELIVEIAASSVSIDVRAKLRAYRRARVREYLVWRTLDAQFDWWILEADDYRPNAPDAQGILHSQVFPGLILDMQALLAMDGAKVLERLKAGLNSPAHAEFVARLQTARA